VAVDGVGPATTCHIVTVVQPTTQLLPGVVAAATVRNAIDTGFRFECEPNGEVLTSIIRMIDAERQCCQFLRFQLTVAAALGPVVLEVTGPGSAIVSPWPNGHPSPREGWRTTPQETAYRTTTVPCSMFIPQAKAMSPDGAGVNSITTG
jgi:hypothetical protein